MFMLAYEDSLDFSGTGLIDIQIEKEDNNSLIDANKTKNAQSALKNKNSQKQKIKINARQIQHQRALDYMDNKNRIMLPIF